MLAFSNDEQFHLCVYLICLPNKITCIHFLVGNVQAVKRQTIQELLTNAECIFTAYSLTYNFINILHDFTGQDDSSCFIYSVVDKVFFKASWSESCTVYPFRSNLS